MTQPTHIRAMSEGDGDDGHTVKAIEQFVYRAHAMDKIEMLARILQAEDRGLTIVFSRTKRTAAKVADELSRPRLRRRRHPRRPRPGGPRAGPARLPQRQGRHPRRHRRRGPWHRRRERHPRRQLPVPRGREDLPAPHRPHRPRRQHRHRRHLRRLGGHAALGPDQQGPRPRHPRARGDLLLLRASLRRPQHPARRPPGGCPKAQQTREGLGAETVEDLGETGKSGGRHGGGGGGSGSGGGGSRSRGRRSRRAGRLRRLEPGRPAARRWRPGEAGSASGRRRSRNRKRTRGGSRATRPPRADRSVVCRASTAYDRPRCSGVVPDDVDDGVRRRARRDERDPSLRVQRHGRGVGECRAGGHPVDG